MSVPGQLGPSVVAGPGDMESCPYCGGTSGVTVIPDTSPEVPGWSCAECATEWWITAVGPHPRRPFLDQLAEDLAARAVLREVLALKEQADTLTDGQLLARLIDCLARLDQICRRGAAPGFPAGHRLNNEVPGTQPVPQSTVTAPESTGTGTTR